MTDNKRWLPHRFDGAVCNKAHRGAMTARSYKRRHQRGQRYHEMARRCNQPRKRVWVIKSKSLPSQDIMQSACPPPAGTGATGPSRVTNTDRYKGPSPPRTRCNPAVPEDANRLGALPRAVPSSFVKIPAFLRSNPSPHHLHPVADLLPKPSLLSFRLQTKLGRSVSRRIQVNCQIKANCLGLMV